MKGFAFLLAVLLSIQGLSQQQPPVRKDSAAVSASISKEQLALEDQLSDVLDHGDRAKRLGDTNTEIRIYEQARDLVNANKLLAEQEDRVLWKLAGAYLDGKKPKQAAPAYAAVLALRSPHCNRESGLVSDCASAQQMLGFCKMQGGDFTGALDDLRHAADDYALAAGKSSLEEPRMVDIKNQAQTRLLTSIALFRTGKRTEAIAESEAALQQLEQVAGNTNIQPSIREDARHSLESGRNQLAALKQP